MLSKCYARKVFKVLETGLFGNFIVIAIYVLCIIIEESHHIKRTSMKVIMTAKQDQSSKCREVLCYYMYLL